MVLKYHGPLGSTEAFFKDSISRDAIIGMNIMFALWGVKGLSGVMSRLITVLQVREMNLQSRHNLHWRLGIHGYEHDRIAVIRANRKSPTGAKNKNNTRQK